ncbi:hypothetical protein ACH4E7_28515 [Kitasatospora sp. NPDC018058]|uniref:hypothetical protein n=1 Tax=Kitasatospora sp. NPDC018058 TaxID=3364025 RepID=UPI0037C1577C
METSMDTSMETLLYAAELVEENGTFTLVIQDVRRGTVQTTPVPKSMVDKLPTFLSALSAKLNPVPSRDRW